jgi:flagellar biogenesis protein FliO
MDAGAVHHNSTAPGSRRDSMELMFVLGALGALIVLPLIIVGLVLKLVLRIVFFPIEILAGVLGLVVAGLVLGALGLAAGVLVGALSLAGILTLAVPIGVIGLAVWLVVRLIRPPRGFGRATRSGNHPRSTL